jgi:signal transduction histidine kinase
MTWLKRLWPRSMQNQLLLGIALALLLAQGIGAVLIYREQADRREAQLVHTAALRIFGVLRDDGTLPQRPEQRRLRDDDAFEGPRALRHEISPVNPIRSGERRLRGPEGELREMLEDQGVQIAEVLVFPRAIADDPVAKRRVERRRLLLGQHSAAVPHRAVIAAVQRQGSPNWIVVRILVPPGNTPPLAGLILQTLLIYGLLVGATALLLRRIVRPLKQLAGQVEGFAQTRAPGPQLEPQGPDDVRRLIVAQNALEDRIVALLDEKDVMLGAIGHDLKTPLAALRVRIESVENESERGKMAATIEDITRSLDDILSLARVGRPSNPLEPAELSALVAQVCEEYEDMGEPVTFAAAKRVVLTIRTTWLRRALRNLIGNALRYGGAARVMLARDARGVAITVEDDGPGIPETDLARMLEPFTRGDPSRNSTTGGAGLGLTLARAIADQHGGTLTLANRRSADGAETGLTATLRLPLA